MKLQHMRKKHGNWWCPKCGYVSVVTDRWQSSKAIVDDTLCAKCGAFGERDIRLIDIVTTA